VGGDGGRQRPGALASAWGGGVASEAGVEEEAPAWAQRRRRGNGGRRGPGQWEAAARREACWGVGAQGGGTGRRRRGGRSSERVAELGAARSEGEKEEEPARPSIYRESLRYRVKSKTGT